MYSLLAVEPVMSEAELRESLARYKELYYNNPQIYMPGLDELEHCLSWMALNSNGQFLNFDTVRVIVDKDEEVASRLRWSFDRLRASAQHYVQLWHYSRSMTSMTTESLTKALRDMQSYRKDDALNLGALFWAENNAPDFLGGK